MIIALTASQQASEALVHQDLIYDVGMNNGDDTAYYLRRGFRVVAIEADTRLVRCAAERFRALNHRRRALSSVSR
jgi:16S rRNA A1518/A1519 N6-dimethyltransferase RsmA/KsgA/DIM1 with predicted DNA glycosylase/AP lyase activity